MAKNHRKTSRAIFFLSTGKPIISSVHQLDLF
jgi:hypothetical protein